MGCPPYDFNEVDEEIQKIVNSLPKKEREKLIEWINDLLGSNYSGWEQAMGRDL